MPYDYSDYCVFTRIDQFITALALLPADCCNVRSYSIEGPPCVLIEGRWRQFFESGADQQMDEHPFRPGRRKPRVETNGALLAIIDDRDYGPMFSDIQEIEQPAFDRQMPDQLIAKWTQLKDTFPDLENTEMWLKNEGNFGHTFLERNAWWFQA